MFEGLEFIFNSQMEVRQGYSIQHVMGIWAGKRLPRHKWLGDLEKILTALICFFFSNYYYFFYFLITPVVSSTWKNRSTLFIFLNAWIRRVACKCFSLPAMAGTVRSLTVSLYTTAMFPSVFLSVSRTPAVMEWRLCRLRGSQSNGTQFYDCCNICTSEEANVRHVLVLVSVSGRGWGLVGWGCEKRVGGEWRGLGVYVWITAEVTKKPEAKTNSCACADCWWSCCRP